MNENYALSNPISLLVGKPRSEYTREDLVRIVQEKQLERITFHYTALDGKFKELKIPVADRRQAERILALGERVDGSSLFKGLVDSSLSDLYVVPIYKTAFLNPFDPGSLDFICRYLTREGEMAPFALDSILNKAADLFRKNTGMEFHALGELEFFLLSKPTTGIFSARKQTGYHSGAPFAKNGAILNEMTHHIAQITGAVKYNHSEVGYVERVRSDLAEIKDKHAEQMEIEFLPTPVEETGDILVLARWLIRNIAYKHGCVATFAPKLEEGIAGNGMHVHMAVMKDGRNVMTREDGELSNAARGVIGGLCTYADSLNAFGNTTSSAYLRLVPNQEAPTHICWSDLNRSSMIRVPLAWGKHRDLAKKLNTQQDEGFTETGGLQTVELRSPDGSALTHLLLAGITLAAQWGLTHEESLKVADRLYVQGNVFKDAEILKRLPALSTSCVQAAEVLLEKRRLYERDGIFPPAIIDYMVKILRAEDDLNMNESLVDLPADDRLHQTRKIMHRDLHRH